MPYQEPQMKQVNQALATILADNRFNASPQMSAFLAYIVEQTLAGNADRIKAYTIAIDALGKSDDFDPQSNPSVRVLAKRLRDTLAQYYDSAPKTEIRICLKPGSYVPQFKTFDSIPPPRNQKSITPNSDRLTVFDKPLTPTLSIGFAKYHRQTTVLGVMLMAAVAWKFSPDYQKVPLEPTIASAMPAQNILAIDIASMEHINRSKERPPLPSITIVNDNYQDLDYQLISHAIHSELSQYQHIILGVASKDDEDASSPKWPEDYLLHYSRKENDHIDIFVSHAKSGKIIQRKKIELPSNSLKNSKEELVSTKELTEFSQSLLHANGTILQDYKTRGELTPTMQCAFLFDAYYANKTMSNRNAATQCAEHLHNDGSIISTPRIF